MTNPERDLLSAVRIEFAARGDNWSSAEEPIRVPVGSRVAFRFGLPIDHEVQWRGARERRLTPHSSTAVKHFRSAGVHAVQVDVYDLDGRRLGSVCTRVDVVERPDASLN